MGRQHVRSLLEITYGIGLLLLLVVWNAVYYPHPSISDWVVLYTLAGLLLLVEHFKIDLHDDRDTLHLETVYLAGFFLAYPIHVVVWGGVLYAVISALREPRRKHIQVMNSSIFVISAVAAKLVYGLLPTASSMTLHIFPLAVYAAVYILVNVILVSIYFLLDLGKQGFGVIRSALNLQFFVVYAITLLIGILLEFVLMYAGLAGAILFTGLTLLVAYSYRDYFKMVSHFRELAIRDELTGLSNHRHVQSVMDELFESGKPFAFLMVDVDHFKRYNEAWGHVRGDEALQTVARLLQENARDGEEVARYSGEEFALVLPNSDLDAAQERAESIRNAIESWEFPGAERLPGKKLTISIGIAHYPTMATQKKELLMMADDALYKGKITGRNKVSLYSSVIDELQSELTVSTEDQEIIKTIRVFLAILNSKDRYTYAHTERDVRYVEALANKIGLSEERMKYLRWATFLHDIGKVEIPHEVLLKRGPLTREEWIIMRSHVELGVNIIRPIDSLAACIPIVRHHHERFDGAGYPDGIKGLEIPLEARILTIADSFDAMTTSRPYQKKRSMEDAFRELRACAGKQFDPELVEPFIETVREIGLLAEELEIEEPA